VLRKIMEKGAWLYYMEHYHNKANYFFQMVSL
jgi:hypothetical protein